MKILIFVYCFGPILALLVGGALLFRLRNYLNRQPPTVDVCRGRSFRILRCIRVATIIYGGLVSAYFFCLPFFAYPGHPVAAVVLGSLVGGLVMYPTILYYLQTQNASISLNGRQFVCISGKTTINFCSEEIESVTLTKKAYLVNLKNGEQKRIARNFVKQFRGFNIIEEFLFALAEQ